MLADTILGENEAVSAFGEISSFLAVLPSSTAVLSLTSPIAAGDSHTLAHIST